MVQAPNFTYPYVEFGMNSSRTAVFDTTTCLKLEQQKRAGSISAYHRKVVIINNICSIHATLTEWRLLLYMEPVIQSN